MPQLRDARARHRRFLLVIIACVVVCLALIPTYSSAADATIGVYADPGGYSCSLNGDNPGLVTAYVVIKPGGSGVRGARFAAPIPSCFHAVFLGEMAPGLLSVSGSSQTGISVLSPFCEESPFQVLQITYLNNGGTTPCCPFPIVEDPSAGALEAIDCAFGAAPITSTVARLNANASCQCSPTYSPPNPPFNPSPANGATLQPAGSTLSWNCSDPNALPMTCDLYFGTDPNPPLVFAGSPTNGVTTHNPGALSFSTTYYWRVVVRNATLAETSGPVWSFTTSPGSAATVANVSPANGANFVIATTSLSWYGSDPDGLPLTYDVYFGTDPSPPVVATGRTSQAYTPGPLAYTTTYYWRIVAHEVGGPPISTAIWSFTTKAQNEPPGPVTIVSPPDGSTGRSLTTDLEWQCTDPEGQTLNYDVYFGTSSNSPKIVSNRGPTFYTVSGLQPLTVYYWRVVARDPGGLETSSSTWTFTTRLNQPPAAPSNPAPADNSTNHGSDVTLQWQCSDPEGQTITYDVYLGASNPPALLSSNFAQTRFNPVPREYSTTYWWRIVARDASGAETSGPIWTFTTRANSPPNAPSAIMPIPGQTLYPIAGQLRWSCTDPDQQALVFDVYFGTAVNPPLVVTGQPYTALSPGPMQAATTYRWRVVARDTYGAETSGPVWSFTTASSSNQQPSTPSNPNPPNGYTQAPRNPVLSWYSLDPDGNPLVYSITVWNFDNWSYYYYHQQTTVPQLAISNLAKGVEYSWKVEVTDGVYDVQGPIWTFHVSGGTVLVLFSKFEARQEEDGVRIAWDLSSDEAMDGLTLYRRTGADSPRAIMNGAVSGDRGTYLDRDVESTTTYQYELVIRTADGNEFRSPMATVTMPARKLTLHQNVPNPFNPQTAIRYDLPSSGRAQLFVLDVNGRLVRTLVNEEQTAGSHSVVWNGRDDAGNAVASGVYFSVLDAGKHRLTRKLVLLK